MIDVAALHMLDWSSQCACRVRGVQRWKYSQYSQHILLERGQE